MERKYVTSLGKWLVFGSHNPSAERCNGTGGTEIAPRRVIVTDIIFFSLSTCVIFSIQRKFYLYLLARLSTAGACCFFFSLFCGSKARGGDEKTTPGLGTTWSPRHRRPLLVLHLGGQKKPLSLKEHNPWEGFGVTKVIREPQI